MVKMLLLQSCWKLKMVVWYSFGNRAQIMLNISSQDVLMQKVKKEKMVKTEHPFLYWSQRKLVDQYKSLRYKNKSIYSIRRKRKVRDGLTPHMPHCIYKMFIITVYGKDSSHSCSQYRDCSHIPFSYRSTKENKSTHESL